MAPLADRKRAKSAAPKKKAKTTQPRSRGSARKPKMPVSPLAPKNAPELPAIAGVTLATAQSGTRYKGRDDLMLAVMETGTSAAGVFTTSKAPSAAVEWCQSRLQEGRGNARALLVNAGNANAFTGKAGFEAATAIASAAASAVSCRRGDVFIGSTGVIGEPLNVDKIADKLPDMAQALAPDSWLQAARAICTTDTFPKLATATTEIDGVPVTINGIAKGSGMIAPDMATMLAYIFTDAAIPSEVLQTLLMLTVHDSFNMITVDGDTSTSDTVMLFATGKCAAHRSINRPGDPRLRDFREKLAEVATDLAQQIVRDGEGATKFVTITVTGAANARAARKIANSIANSPLVKTAIAGEDPNWGRIIMAVGKAGEAADRDAMRIEIGGVTVARDGMVDPDYKEATVAKYMKNQEIGISVDVGVGRGEATVWTCDLTHRYIEINADYRS